MERMTIVQAQGPPDDPLGRFLPENHMALEGDSSGPLAGLTFGVKDIFHIDGHRTGFGHPDWLRTHPPSQVTATAVQRLLDAGARMVGKTHTDELAYSLSGQNMHYGTPINPVAPDRIAGGSSCGSVSAVAGGLGGFRTGDRLRGLGSTACKLLRRPRHSPDSWPGALGRRHPFGPSFDVAGWFARDADVLQRVAGALLGEEPEAPPPKRLLYVRDAFELVDPQVAQALDAAVQKAATAIGVCQEVTVSPEGLTAWFETFRVLQAAEVWGNHGEWIQAVKPRFGRGVRERFAWASQVEEKDVAACKNKHRAIKARIYDLIGEGDVLCLPSSPRVAPLKNTPTNDIEIRFRHQAMCLLCIAGLAGLPQISLPLATIDGLPLGLSLVGRPGADTQLLALSQTLMRDG